MTATTGTTGKRIKTGNKEFEDLLNEAARQGWFVNIGKGGHYKCYSPDGQHIVVVPVSPSSSRTIRVKKSEFRRKGLDI